MRSGWRPARWQLAAAVRDGALGRLTVERADGERAGGDSPLTQALEAAGFRPHAARDPAPGRVSFARPGDA